jgi:exodeoxyribonuclease V gamma subunit
VCFHTKPRQYLFACENCWSNATGCHNAWRAVLGRIQLVEGRFSVEDFADWLSLNATQLRYGLDISNTERMIELLINAGFKRGLDAQHLRRSLSQDDEDFRFSFKFALDRLALGIAIPEHTIFENTLSYAQILQSDFELVAKLIQIYQDFDVCAVTG